MNFAARPSGYNEMRWKCDRDGCFNIKRRPKIEAFAVCFPRRINFGDVDGIVELGGHYCMLEWKTEISELRTGQLLTYQRFTSHIGNIVFLVEGDAETMQTKRYCLFWKGKQHPWQPAVLDEIRQRIKNWADYAQKPRAAA